MVFSLQIKNFKFQIYLLFFTLYDKPLYHFLLLMTQEHYGEARCSNSDAQSQYPPPSTCSTITSLRFYTSCISLCCLCKLRYTIWKCNAIENGRNFFFKS